MAKVTTAILLKGTPIPITPTQLLTDLEKFGVFAAATFIDDKPVSFAKKLKLADILALKDLGIDCAKALNVEHNFYINFVDRDEPACDKILQLANMWSKYSAEFLSPEPQSIASGKTIKLEAYRTGSYKKYREAYESAGTYEIAESKLPSNLANSLKSAINTADALGNDELGYVLLLNDWVFEFGCIEPTTTIETIQTMIEVALSQA